MTERVRKRISKWDVKEVPDKFPIGARQDNALLGRSSENTNHNGSKQEWNSPKNTASDTNWSDTNPDSAIKSEDNSKWLCLQPPGNIAGHKDANVIGDFDGVSQNMKMQDGNGIYSRSTSPVRDGWRRQSRSRSPKCGWSKSHRSRSRSPRYGLRNRSRSPLHGLANRSESPPHGLVRNPEGRNDRIRGRSVSLCNDFARGRCRRGSQCRFLHEETNRYEVTRHSGSLPGENRGNRHERGGSSGNPSSEDRGYSRERLSPGHNSQMNNRSSDRCINFLKGNCHRGSSCRFIHENTKGDDHGTRERTHGKDTQSYPDHGHTREPYRSNNTPCRYFLRGNCRKGNSCMFSHGGAVHTRPEGGSADDRPGHNIGNVDKLWGGPKWSDEVTDSTQGGGEGISLNYRSSHIANSSSNGPVWNQKPTWNGNEVADVSSADNRWGHNLRDERKSVGCPNWRNNVVTYSTQGSGEGISLNYRPSHIANSSSDVPVWNQKPTWNDNGVADVRSADNRWGQNLRDERKSVGGPNWRNDVPDHPANFSAEGWSMNDRGGYIAQSGWDNLTYCKSLLDPKLNIEAAEDRPRGRLDDERQDHNLDDVNKSLGDSKRGDEVAESVNDSAKGKSMNDVRGCITSSRSDDTGWTNQLIRPTWNDEAADSEEKKCPQWGDNGSNGQVGDNVEYKSLGGTTWNNSAPDSEVMNALGRRNDVDDRIDYSVDDQNKTWGVSTLSDNPSDQDVHRSAPWINDGNSVSIGVQLPEGNGELPTFRNTPSSRAEGDQYPDIRNSEKAGLGIQDLSSLTHVTMFSQEQCSQEVSGQRYHPTAARYPEGQQRPASTVTTHPDASNMNTQSQQTVLSLAPDLNGPIKGVPSPNRPTLFQMVEKIKAGKIDPEISPITSGALVSPNAVTSEQVAQLSHLSASLAQIFGNSQQLPQLYATLNPTPVVPSCPNSIQVGASVGESFVSSNQDSWSQKQYDPVNDSMESSQISDHPPGFSGYPIKQNNMANHESQTPLQSSVLSSVAGGSTGNNPIMYDNLLHQQSNEANQLHSVGNERVVDDAVKEHDTAHSGDTNADAHMDGDKKCKDVKGMRIFKFALVGFVKEVLKPTWKEGLLTKEAHKTIVKKVVDKVTGSVDLVPQTQNKIDQYLAYSKTKLTKLVEAYLEKYVKS